MLTLLETTDAIRALDTDNDIIRQACLQVANVTSTVTNAKELEDKILDDYLFNPNSALTIPDFISGLTACVVVTLTASCYEGQEVQLLHDYQKQFVSDYAESLMILMRKKTKNNPAEAIERMVNLIRQFKELK